MPKRVPKPPGKRPIVFSEEIPLPSTKVSVASLTELEKELSATVSRIASIPAGDLASAISILMSYGAAAAAYPSMSDYPHKELPDALEKILIEINYKSEPRELVLSIGFKKASAEATIYVTGVDAARMGLEFHTATIDLVRHHRIPYRAVLHRKATPLLLAAPGFAAMVLVANRPAQSTFGSYMLLLLVVLCFVLPFQLPGAFWYSSFDTQPVRSRESAARWILGILTSLLIVSVVSYLFTWVGTAHPQK